MSSLTRLCGLEPGLQRLCILTTIYVSAFASVRVEIALDYQEPVLGPADLIFTAVLLEMRAVHKTEAVV